MNKLNHTQDLTARLEKVAAVSASIASIEKCLTFEGEGLIKQCEVARMLGVCGATILKARLAKKITGVRFGRRWKYRPNEVRRYVLNNF